MNDSAIIIPDASALTVDTSCIDVSEVENQEDKDFLLEKGENILRIVARAALEVGQQIAEVQDRWPDQTGAGLKKWYESLNLYPAQAQRWACKYRAYIEYVSIFGDEEAIPRFNRLSDEAASKLFNLPQEYKEALLGDISIGEIPTRDKVKELCNRTDVKLSKAEQLKQEALARKSAATEKRTEAKEEHGIDSFEYQKARQDVNEASRSIKLYERQIVDLQAQIEAEKLKTAEEVEAKKIAEADKASMEKELQQLKFDDAKVRAERVKKLSTTLTVSIPQALADVSKFFAEIDHYPEEVRKHVYANAKNLADTIADHL